MVSNRFFCTNLFTGLGRVSGRSPVLLATGCVADLAGKTLVQVETGLYWHPALHVSQKYEVES